jgi:DNA polymerase III epsilon subunit-like protein
VLYRFHEFIKDADFIIGHNAKRFDYPFIVSEFRRNGIKFDGIMCKDTMWIARAKLRRVRGYSLKALCEHFDVVNVTAHRALSDVYATFEVYKNLQRI